MGFLDRFKKPQSPSVVVIPDSKEEKIKEFSPPNDGIYLPQGCSRQADMIVIEQAYFKTWIEQYPDSLTASSKMIAYLKKTYPAITRFLIRK